MMASDIARTRRKAVMFLQSMAMMRLNSGAANEATALNSIASLVECDGWAGIYEHEREAMRLINGALAGIAAGKP